MVGPGVGAEHPDHGDGGGKEDFREIDDLGTYRTCAALTVCYVDQGEPEHGELAKRVGL